jgi:predicted  nucleic acid-binding Zn-ribbon protein
MVRRTATSLQDREQTLRAARDEASAEVSRLEREEHYLAQQVRDAEDQVRYYERLLGKLRRDWGRPAGLPELVRKLG